MFQLTSSQLMTWAIIPIITGSLSFLGSSAIVYGIILDRQKKILKVYHRLMFAMSALDIIKSFATALSTIPVPKDASPAWGNYGNKTTCTLQALCSILGSGVVLYNCALSWYFLLSIRYGMKDNSLQKVIEPTIHIFCIAWPIIWAIAGLFLDVYGFSGSRCWVAPDPLDCIKNDQVECIRGAFAYSFRWLYAGVPMILSFLFIFISQFLIFWTIWQQKKKMQKYGSHAIQYRIARRESFPGRRESYLRSKNTIPFRKKLNHNLNVRRRSFSVKQHDFISSRKISTPNQTQPHIEVAKRAAAYVVSTFFTYIWCFSFRAQEQHSNSNPPIWLIFIGQFSYPLQGFWNCLIYKQPQIQKIHKAYPDKSRLWALKESIIHPDVTYSTFRLKKGKNGHCEFRTLLNEF